MYLVVMMPEMYLRRVSVGHFRTMRLNIMATRLQNRRGIPVLVKRF